MEGVGPEVDGHRGDFAAEIEIETSLQVTVADTQLEVRDTVPVRRDREASADGVGAERRQGHAGDPIELVETVAGDGEGVVDGPGVGVSAPRARRSQLELHPRDLGVHLQWPGPLEQQDLVDGLAAHPHLERFVLIGAVSVHGQGTARGRGAGQLMEHQAIALAGVHAPHVDGYATQAEILQPFEYQARATVRGRNRVRVRRARRGRGFFPGARIQHRDRVDVLAGELFDSDLAEKQRQQGQLNPREADRDAVAAPGALRIGDRQPAHGQRRRKPGDELHVAVYGDIQPELRGRGIDEGLPQHAQIHGNVQCHEGYRHRRAHQHQKQQDQDGPPHVVHPDPPLDHPGIMPWAAGRGGGS